MSLTTVQNGLVVSLAYTLKMDDGEVVDESPAGEPLQYLHGASNIIPGLEKELTGMAINESKKVVVQPEDGYGPYDPESVESVMRELFPGEVTLEPGVVLTLRDEAGNLFDATIVEVTDKEVTLDFNHPLAGEALHFDVTVVELREATPEELEHGHPHLPGMPSH